MSIRETGKQRANRIDGRVLEGSRWLERGRFILAGVAGLAAIGWWGAGVCFRRADAWASPGPVAAVHATWSNDCKKCHTDFKAIRDDALFASNAARSIADDKCQCCHRVAGKDDDPLGPFGHHALANSAYDLGCATCHHEHRGLSQALARTSDATCTMCHAHSDLAQLTKGTPAIADLKPVMQFAAGGQHPYFRSLGDPERGTPKSVPRKLRFAKFSHHLHMTPGIAQDREHVPVLTLAQIDEADRPRYKKEGQTDSSLVQLDCSSCHRLDSRGSQATKIEGLPDAALAANTSGAYMLPITYENQCRACHALTIEPCAAVEGEAAPRDTATVPHRLSAARLAEEVEKYWENRYFKDHPTALRRLLPLPGSSAEPENQAANDWIKQRSRQSASHLNRTCSKCHQFTDGQTGQRAVSTDELVDASIPRVAPVEIPQRLLAFARFDHLAHRAVDCSGCHQDAYPPKGSGDKAPPKDGFVADPKSNAAPTCPEEAANPEPKESPLMIDNRDKCLECHGPRRESGETPQGGARFDCAECHRYHDRDDPTSKTLASAPR